MTALKQFEKLEATGLWRETLATQRREVYVSFGEASLMIRNQANEPLSHWSLAAVERLNPGAMPAIYAPNPEAAESLEIEDETMVGAIEKIRSAIERRRPHPGRLRLVIFLAIIAIIGLLAIFWLPEALVRQTLNVAPREARLELSQSLLGHIARLTGMPCSSTVGNRALKRLEGRLLPAGGKLLLLPSGIAKSGALPGGIVLLNRALVEDFEGPEWLAGYVILETTRAEVDPPLARLLHFAGVIETFRLLTTGEIKDDVLRRYAETLLTYSAPMPPQAQLLARFASVNVASSPLAYDIDPTGETTLGLIEADPLRGRRSAALMTDAEWVGLQGICGG